MNNLIVVIILFLLSTGSAVAQKSPYQIRAKGRELFVSHKGKTHALNLSDKIDAAKITDAEILFADRKNDFFYMVIDVSGQSKSKQDDRQCGAGTESNLIWIKLDQSWRILDSRSVRYESCWSSTSNDNFQMTGHTMSIEIKDFHNGLDITISYNAEKPEKGFQIIQKALKEPE